MPSKKTEPLEQTEIPIYGAGKLGTYYPLEAGATAYEITDHLGNVRALLRDNDVSVYTATMEDNGQQEYTNPREQEKLFFLHLSDTEKDDPYMNHTSETETIVSDPSMSAYLFWQDGMTGMDAEDKAIGPAAALRVNPGDRVALETWVRYRNEVDYTSGVPLLMLAQLFANTFAGTGGFEGYSATETAGTFESAVGNGGFGTDGVDETVPFAYLNFILFDDNLQMLDAGWQRVPADAGFDAGEEGLPDMHRKVEFPDPITVSDAGYIYIWVSNESENTAVWFDDLKITHTTSFVAQATDYGVWGDVIREQKADPKAFYKFGYQGQFSERDTLTGWNHFELREYDPVIGRWTAVDPKRIGWSPYIGMYNNPVSGTDPDGGGPDDWFKDQNGNVQWFASSAEGFSDAEGNSWTNIGTELLNFDGQFLTHLWQTGNEFDGFNVFSQSYHAVSGAPINGNGWATFDYSLERQQLKNVGPIPEGLYSINKSGLQLLGDMPSYKQLLAPFGFTAWPGGSSSWGNHRWWPSPESTTNTFGRSGFSIHGGVAWGSRGCIDLGAGMTEFARDFMGNASNEKVYLNVKYTTPSISIIPYGNIWRQK